MMFFLLIGMTCVVGGCVMIHPGLGIVAGGVFIINTATAARAARMQAEYASKAVDTD